MVVDNNNLTEWTQLGLTPCQSYSLELEPIFEEIPGEATQIKFDTFPDQTFFEVQKVEKVLQAASFIEPFIW